LYPKLYKTIEGGEAFLFFNEKLALRRLEKPDDPFAADQPGRKKKEFSYDLCRATYQGTPDYARMSGGLVEQILLKDVNRLSRYASGVPFYVKGTDNGGVEAFWYLVEQTNLSISVSVRRTSDFDELRGSAVEVSELFAK